MSKKPKETADITEELRPATKIRLLVQYIKKNQQDLGSLAWKAVSSLFLVEKEKVDVSILEKIESLSPEIREQLIYFSLCRNDCGANYSIALKEGLNVKPKKQLCIYSLSGNCKLDSACKFLHLSHMDLWTEISSKAPIDFLDVEYFQLLRFAQMRPASQEKVLKNFIEIRKDLRKITALRFLIAKQAKEENKFDLKEKRRLKKLRAKKARKLKRRAEKVQQAKKEKKALKRLAHEAASATSENSEPANKKANLSVEEKESSKKVETPLTQGGDACEKKKKKKMSENKN